MFSSSVHHFHKKTSLIRKFPVEILTMIFFLVGPASTNNPYVYLPLSWVCRYWRSIVLENPKFWTVIGYKKGLGRSDDFVREAIRRSEPHKFDFFSCPQGFYIPGCKTHYAQLVVSESSRIRTLLIRNETVFNRGYITWPKSFPQLENLILCSQMNYVVETGRDSLTQLFLACRPRYVELSCALLYKQMFHSLSRVEWLKIHYSASFNVSIIYNLLERLPNLRVLNLIPSSSAWTLVDDGDVSVEVMPPLILPNLRMLSLNPGRGEFRSIHAPTLDYLGLSHFPTQDAYDWDFLGSIDFPMIKNFRIKLYDLEFNSSKGNSWEIISLMACISTGSPNETCEVFENFHKQVSVSLANVDDHLILPPKNSFHIELPWSRCFGTLFDYLKRATNLVELSIDYQSLQISEDDNLLVVQVLDNFDKITHLNILHSLCFVSVCDLLTQQRRVPRLERLAYHSSDKPNYDAGFVVKHVRVMQQARIRNSCEQLKILEIKGFAALSPAEVEEIEGLGIQLIQNGML